MKRTFNLLFLALILVLIANIVGRPFHSVQAAGAQLWSNSLENVPLSLPTGWSPSDVYAVGEGVDADGNTLPSLYQSIGTPSIHYVKWDASGANNGTSWVNAYIDLQSALAAASSGDEIWVVAGTYKPTSNTDRTISFTLKNGVAIYGGFAGTETIQTQRDFKANFTVLSGDIGSVGDNSDNSYHVVVGSNTNNSAILDGFTVTGGNANLIQYDTGGGMLNKSGGPTVANIIFSDNSAGLGGGLYNGGDISFPNGSHPILENVSFEDNSALEGGGMENQFYSSPTLTNVTFRNNTAVRSGGGMINYDHSNPTLTNVTFSSNTASAGGGMMNWISSPTLMNATFYANSATDQGGGISNSNGSNPNLENITLSGNTSLEGGGIYNGYGSDPSIVNSILYNNSGGEIFDVSGTRVVKYSIVQSGYPGASNLDSDPLLGPLQDNGGSTETMALGAGSPAIDAGDDANCPDADQRGVARPQGIHCDIGAYEYQIATPTFEDVHTDYWAWDFIERLYRAGITGGCGGNPPTYCPETTVTRGQMAVFLERGIHGSSYTPPAVGDSTGFVDVPVDYWSAAWIKQLAAEGITGGCGSGNYCPEYPVTRSQMAIFLLRSKYGASYSPPAVGGSTGFGDVPFDYWAAAWVKQLVTEGITAGCGDGNYCPEVPVSRAQMAVFLVRTFNLP